MMSLPTGALVVREHRGKPFSEAKWRDTRHRQIKRRAGAAWLERNARTGAWRRRRGRIADGFLDEKMAIVRMHELIETHANEHGAGDRSATATFDDAATDWLRHQEHIEGVKPSTLADYRYMLTAPDAEPRKRGRRRANARVMREFGGQSLGRITTSQVERWLDRMDAEGVGKRTINKHRQLICSVLEFAARRPERYGITENVARAAPKRREADPAPLDFYEPEEVAALYTVAAFTGLRLGELLALRWQHVSFERATVSVVASWSAGALTTPTSRKVRTVPLATPAAVAVARLEERGRFTGAGDLVFCGAAGEPLDPSALRRRYRRTQSAAGLRPLRFHDLRHSFGSLVVREIDTATLKAWMGHAKLTTTERYLHAKPRHTDVARLDRAFAGAAGQIEEPVGDGAAVR